VAGADDQQSAVADPYISYRGCRSKNRYATERDANQKAAIAFERRGHWLRAYPCTECGGWHLTHQKALPDTGWRPPARSQEVIRRELRDEQRDWRRRRGNGKRRGGR
jgi:hypothetical protein